LKGINARGHHRSQRFSGGPKPAYQLTIDFGETIELENLAQITKRYSKADLLERQIVAVVNFPKNKLVSS
jgi:tRNA-binding protein